MEVRHRQQFAPALGQPGLLGAGLALRAMPVAAGVIDVAGRAAGIAGLDMAAQRGGATGEDGTPDLGLGRRKIVRGEIGRTVATQHLGQARAGWPTSAQSGQGIEQFERRGGAGEAALRQMQVAHGGADMAVPEQALDGVQIDAGFQQVGGEAVAQGVDAGGVGRPAASQAAWYMRWAVVSPMGPSPALLGNSQVRGRQVCQYRRKVSSRRGESSV
jgi:hypothetical protein